MQLRDTLRLPSVGGPMVWSVAGNVPVAALGLLLVLHVEGLTGRFATAGLVAGAYAVGLGVSAPVVGRLVDRRGQPSVIAPLTVVAVVGLVVLAVLPASAPAAVLALVAFLVGVGMPPGGSVVRAMWTTELTDGDVRHRVFAIHSAAIELSYIAGPVVLAGGLATISTDLAVLVSAALVGLSSALYLTRPAVRRWRGQADHAPGLAGPLATPAVRVMLAALLCMGMAVGAIEVGTAATADADGSAGIAGLLLGAWGLGSMLSAIAIARRPAPTERITALLRAYAVLAPIHAALAIAGSPLGLAPLLFVAGVALAPVLVAEMTLLGDVAPAGTLSETYSWSTCCIGGGLALGSAIGGALADHATRDPFLLAGAMTALAATVVLAGRGVLARGLPTDQHAPPAPNVGIDAR